MTTQIVRKIIVVGAGWYGCHIAMELAKAGHQVTLIEREEQITSQCSGKFGIRLHRGPHYPRSPATRLACQSVFDRFWETYPELVHEHEESIYAYGNRDAHGLPSKISLQHFEAVCYETGQAYRLSDTAMTRFADIATAFELREPSVAVGSELRRALERRLNDLPIEVLLGTEVINCEPISTGRVVIISRTSQSGATLSIKADFVLNATGFQSLISPQDIPGARCPAIEVVYQPCFAFEYEDLHPQDRPISFIVMDGWYPCIMPVIDHDQGSGSQPKCKNYIATHGSLTILGSFQRLQEASELLREVGETDVLVQFKEAVEKELARFFPGFSKRFLYRGWRGSVLAKPRSKSEFRSAIVYERDRLIHILPGKVSNIFNASDEVIRLVRKEEGDVVTLGTEIHYANGGSFDNYVRELRTTNDTLTTSTDSLQTYSEFATTNRFK